MAKNMTALTSCLSSGGVPVKHREDVILSKPDRVYSIIILAKKNEEPNTVGMVGYFNGMLMFVKKTIQYIF